MKKKKSGIRYRWNREEDIISLKSTNTLTKENGSNEAAKLSSKFVISLKKNPNPVVGFEFEDIESIHRKALLPNFVLASCPNEIETFLTSLSDQYKGNWLTWWSPANRCFVVSCIPMTGNRRFEHISGIYLSSELKVKWEKCNREILLFENFEQLIKVSFLQFVEAHV